VQYVFFEKKGIRSVQWGLGQSPPEAGGFLRIFVLKVTLQSARLHSPNNLVAPPVSVPVGLVSTKCSYLLPAAKPCGL